MESALPLVWAASGAINGVRMEHTHTEARLCTRDTVQCRALRTTSASGCGAPPSAAPPPGRARRRAAPWPRRGREAAPRRRSRAPRRRGRPRSGGTARGAARRPSCAPPRAARHGGRRPDALLQRLRAEQLEARHLVLMRQLPQHERAPRLLALPLAEVELVGEEVADEGGEAGEVRFEHRDLGGVALLHADAKHRPKEHGPHAEGGTLLTCSTRSSSSPTRKVTMPCGKVVVAPHFAHVGGEGGGRNHERREGGRRRRRSHADLAESRALSSSGPKALLLSALMARATGYSNCAAPPTPSALPSGAATRERSHRARRHLTPAGSCGCRCPPQTARSRLD